MGVPAPSRGSLGTRLSLFPGLECFSLLGRGVKQILPQLCIPKQLLCFGQLGDFKVCEEGTTFYL